MTGGIDKNEWDGGEPEEWIGESKGLAQIMAKHSPSQIEAEWGAEIAEKDAAAAWSC